MAIGMCRLDKSSVSDDLFEISILVAPDFQKKGFGRLILQESCELFFEIYPDYRILAKVHAENTNSRRLFESENFKLSNRNDGFDYYFKI
jgi:L-amino acid N-acyltransferase YncA